MLDPTIGFWLFFYGKKMKKCPRCDKEKGIEKFGKDKTRPKGITSWCKDCRNQKAKKLRETEEYREWNKKHKKQKRRDNIKTKITHNLRVRLRDAVMHNKNESALLLLGCSIEYFKEYFESKFLKGMNWDNYGSWHIDHIIPCSWFDMESPLDRMLCFNYKNLQPLWAEDNLKKSNI